MGVVCVHLYVQGFGIVMKVSDGILGITLLAWGNSIGGIYLRLQYYESLLVPLYTICLPVQMLWLI